MEKSLLGGKVICLDENGARCKEFETCGRSFTFGYYIVCNYVIDNEDALGIHCEIRCQYVGRIILQNMSDQYPVTIDGNPLINPRKLANGDRFSVLGNEFIWEFTDRNALGMVPWLQQLGLKHFVPLCLGRNPQKFTVQKFSYTIEADSENWCSKTSQMRTVGKFCHKPFKTNKKNKQKRCLIENCLRSDFVYTSYGEGRTAIHIRTRISFPHPCRVMDELDTTRPCMVAGLASFMYIIDFTAPFLKDILENLRAIHKFDADPNLADDISSGTKTSNVKSSRITAYTPLTSTTEKGRAFLEALGLRTRRIQYEPHSLISYKTRRLEHSMVAQNPLYKQRTCSSIHGSWYAVRIKVGRSPLTSSNIRLLRSVMRFITLRNCLCELIECGTKCYIPAVPWAEILGKIATVPLGGKRKKLALFCETDFKQAAGIDFDDDSESAEEEEQEEEEEGSEREDDDDEDDEDDEEVKSNLTYTIDSDDDSNDIDDDLFYTERFYDTIYNRGTQIILNRPNIKPMSLS